MLTKNIYKNITELHNLFINKDFILQNKIISRNQYNLIYAAKINLSDEFILNISSQKIEITIPLQINNKSYKTTLDSIEDTYNYLEFHIENYIKNQ